MSRKIQMVDLKSQYQDIKNEIDDSIITVISNAAFINGPEVKQFSQNLKDWNNSNFCVACGNGTDGLQIALMSLGLKPGDEVIVPAFTYIAAVEVIALLGLKPLFVDVDYEDFNIDTGLIEEVITQRTKAIMPVHLYGQCVNMTPLNEIAKKFNLFVIEDLAQAIGSEFNGVKAGNLGDIGVTSFFPSKNLGCYGDGGALFTNNDTLSDKIRMIASHGQAKKYYHDTIGVNSRLDTIQAAILIQKLKRLDDYTQKRQKAASIYDENLKGLDEVLLPLRRTYSSHVFHQYTVKVFDKRDELQLHLKEKGIPSMIYYPLPIPQQKAYIHYTDQKFPVAIKLCSEVLSLPMHTHLQEDDQVFICNTIKDFFHGK